MVFLITGMCRFLCRCYCIANNYNRQMRKILVGQFQAGREENLHNFALLYCSFSAVDRSGNCTLGWE